MFVVVRVRTGEDFQEVGRLECDKPLMIGRLEECDVAFPNDFEM